MTNELMGSDIHLAANSQNIVYKSRNPYILRSNLTPIPLFALYIIRVVRRPSRMKHESLCASCVLSHSIFSLIGDIYSGHRSNCFVDSFHSNSVFSGVVV